MIDEIVFPYGERKEKIVVKTTNNPYYKDGTEKPYYTISFCYGEKALLLLTREEDFYKPVIEMYGKFKVNNDVISECGEPINDFLNEIKQVIYGGKKFLKTIPSYQMNSKYLKVFKSSQINKTADIKADFKFDGYSIYAGTSQLTFEFDINPAGALGADSLSMSLSKIETYATTAANSLTNINDANINFSIGDSTGLGYTADNVSVISFGELGWHGGICSLRGSNECDIKLDDDTYWFIYGVENWPADGAPLLGTLCHEMAHGIGLGDLSSPAYSDQLMYNQGDQYRDWSIESPQYGDKAGAVWHRPKPSGTIEFNRKNSSDLSPGFLCCIFCS